MVKWMPCRLLLAIELPAMFKATREALALSNSMPGLAFRHFHHGFQKNPLKMRKFFSRKFFFIQREHKDLGRPLQAVERPEMRRGIPSLPRDADRQEQIPGISLEVQLLEPAVSRVRLVSAGLGKSARTEIAEHGMRMRIESGAAWFTDLRCYSELVAPAREQAW